MEQLTEKEQLLLAFALFSAGMRIGPDIFPTVEEIARKLAITEPLKLYGSDWLLFSRTVKDAQTQGVGLFQRPLVNPDKTTT